MTDSMTVHATLPDRIPSRLPWVLAAGIVLGLACGGLCLGQIEIELRVPDETAPPGGVALVFVELTEPEPISGGKTTIRIGTRRTGSAGLRSMQEELLGQPTRIDLLSARDQVSGTVSMSGGTVTIDLVSRDGVFGTEPDLPLIAVALPVSLDAAVGESVAVELELSSFTGPGGIPYTVGTKPGVFTVGGASITTISPFRGAVSGGSVITLHGVGFEPGADVNIEGADVRSVTYVSPSRIDVRLESSLTIRNTTRFRLRNPSGSSDLFYPINQRPEATPGGPALRFLTESKAVLQGVVDTVELETDLSVGTEIAILPADPDSLSVEAGITVPSGPHRQRIRLLGKRAGTTSLIARAGALEAILSIRIDPGSVFQVPVLRNDAGQRLGLALTNRNPTPVQVRLRSFPLGSSGIPSLEVPVDLGPDQQTARFLEEYDPRWAGFSGWIEVSSASPGVYAVFIHVPGDLVRYPGAAAASLGAREFALTFPEATGLYELGLINNNPQPAAVAFSWLSSTGTTLASEVLTVASQDAMVHTIPSLWPGRDRALGELVLRVSSTQPLAGYLGMSGNPLTFGRPVEPPHSADEGVVLPRFIAGQDWDTAIDVHSWSDSPCTVEIRGQEEGGRALPVHRFEVGPKGLHRVLASELAGLNPADLRAGSAEVVSNCRATVSALIRQPIVPGIATAVPSIQVPASEVLFAQVANGTLGGYRLFTGLAVVNRGAVEAEILIGVFSKEGLFQGETTLRLGPGLSTARLLSDLLPGLAPQFGGHVRIQSDQPLAVAEMFGDYDLTFLSTVPASVVAE